MSGEHGGEGGDGGDGGEQLRHGDRDQGGRDQEPDPEREGLRRELAAASARLAAAAAERAGLIERCTRLEREVVEVREASAERDHFAMSSLDKLRTRIETLESDLQARQVRITQVEQALTRTEEAIAQREKEIRTEIEHARVATEETTKEFERRVAKLQTEIQHQADQSRRRDAENAALAEAARRAALEKEHALERRLAAAETRCAEAEAALAEARTQSAALEGTLAENEALAAEYRDELGRRGASGSPRAVRTALADLARRQRERRLHWLALTQPWRLPPARR
jgi:DNA repair exonuclease SbcCD ATPase subunit